MSAGNARTIPSTEVEGGDILLAETAPVSRYPDNGYGAHRIHREIFFRLSLVGRQGVAAVGRKCDHVRQTANRNMTEQLPIRVEKDRFARVTFLVTHHGYSNQFTMNGQALHIASERTDVQRSGFPGMLRVIDLDHIDRTFRAIHDIESLLTRMMGDNFGCGIIEYTGLIGSDHFESDTGMHQRSRH